MFCSRFIFIILLAVAKPEVAANSERLGLLLDLRLLLDLGLEFDLGRTLRLALDPLRARRAVLHAAHWRFILL